MNRKALHHNCKYWHYGLFSPLSVEDFVAKEITARNRYLSAGKRITLYSKEFAEFLDFFIPYRPSVVKKFCKNTR